MTGTIHDIRNSGKITISRYALNHVTQSVPDWDEIRIRRMSVIWDPAAVLRDSSETIP